MQSKSIPGLLAAGWIVLYVAPAQAQQRLPYEQRLANCMSPENERKQWEFEEQFHQPHKTYEENLAWCKANVGPDERKQQPSFGQRLSYEQRMANCMSPENLQGVAKLAKEDHDPSDPYQRLLAWCRKNIASDDR